MQRFAEALDVCFAPGIVGHKWYSVCGPHGAAEQNPAAAARREPGSEVTRNIQVRKRVEPEEPKQFIIILTEKTPRIAGSGVRDDKADVEIVHGVSKFFDKAFFGQIDDNGSCFHA